MRRIEVVAGCLLAVLAVCVAAAPGASAAEIGVCAKKKGGKYENKTCTTTAAMAKQAKYEWEPVSKPLRFVTHSGEIEFSTGPRAGEIRCGFSTSTGEWVDGTALVGELTLEFCDLRRHEHNPDLGCGDMKSELKGRLIGHGETGLGGAEPAEGEAWIETYAEEGAPLFEFSCPPFTGTITGWLSDVVSPLDTALKEGKVGRKFKPSFNVARNEAAGEGFALLTFSGEEPFGASQEGVGPGEVALLEKESGYSKVKIEIRD